MVKIADEYGQKIGGSKRDLWRRALKIEYLSDMNDREKEQYVEKSSIFPTPDYRQMVEDKPIQVVYFIQLVKNLIAVRPNCTFMENVYESYINEVTRMRDALLDLNTWKDCEDFASNYLERNGLIQRSVNGWRYETTLKGSNIGAAKIHNNICNISEDKILRDIRRKEFLYSPYDKFKKKYKMIRKTSFKMVEGERISFNFGSLPCKGISSVYDLMKDEDYILMKDCRVIAYGSEERLEKLIKKEFEESSKTNTNTAAIKRKTKFVPERLERCRRLVNGEMEMSPFHITPDQFLDTFKLHGFEFGNWENNATRIKNLDACYYALIDFCTCLDIKPSELSLNFLSIAFGARGNGGSAVAHYEPERHVINITRNHAGSLAHELGHFLDYTLSEMVGNKQPFTSNARGVESFSKVMAAMKQKTSEIVDTKEDYIPRMKREKDYLEYVLNKEFSRASDENKERLANYLKNNVFISKEDFLAKNADNEDIKVFTRAYITSIKEELELLKKTFVPRAKKLKKETEYAIAGSLYPYYSMLTMEDEVKRTAVVNTDFYENSKKFDYSYAKSGLDYWSSDVELFGRAFACYIKSKCGEKGIINDYLCGYAESAIAMTSDGTIIKAYPEGEERRVINAAIDEFIAECKTLGLFESKLAA